MVLLFCFSCNDDEIDSPILVFLNPSDIQINSNSNERVIITVNAQTSTGSKLNLHIESIDDHLGVRNLFDSTFEKSKITYRYDYIIPAYPDSTESILVFNLSNDVGDEISIAKKILVNKGESLVTEYTGLTIYSSASDKPNAFSLDAVSPGYSTDSITFTSDIVEGSFFDVNGEELSRIWTSNTGISFVQFNGFDYASATSFSIKNAYENGVKLSKIVNIKNSDIYIIGKGSNALGVIQIIAVTDQSSVHDDKYTFSLKLIDD